MLNVLLAIALSNASITAEAQALITEVKGMNASALETTHHGALPCFRYAPVTFDAALEETVAIDLVAAGLSYDELAAAALAIGRWHNEREAAVRPLRPRTRR